MSNSTITITGQLVIYNQFIGKFGSLFEFTGGQITIYENTFKDGGYLSYEKLQGNPEQIYLLADLETSIPYDRYSMDKAQESGVFLFYYYLVGMESNNTHQIYNNTFENIFCQRGCAYMVYGDQYQQFSFEENHYRHMVALDFGSVFAGDLSVSANTRFSNVWLQLYSNELFEENFGSVIYMDAQNVPVTIIEDSIFRNNFGNYGASIEMKGGGGLYCKRCQFEMDDRY